MNADVSLMMMPIKSKMRWCASWRPCAGPETVNALVAEGILQNRPNASGQVLAGWPG